LSINVVEVPLLNIDSTVRRWSSFPDESSGIDVLKPHPIQYRVKDIAQRLVGDETAVEESYSKYEMKCYNQFLDNTQPTNVCFKNVINEVSRIVSNSIR